MFRDSSVFLGLVRDCSGFLTVVLRICVGLVRHVSFGCLGIIKSQDVYGLLGMFRDV